MQLKVIFEDFLLRFWPDLGLTDRESSAVSFAE